MKKKKIGIAIILLVVLFSGLFLWWWTKPIKITTNKIVKVTIKGYDAEVVSSNKQCIQEAIQLVENTWRLGCKVYRRRFTRFNGYVPG